jgi:cystathionine beta-lyase/cystathionine gamma-synthase
MGLAQRDWGEHTRAVHTPPPTPPEQQPLGLPVYRTAAFSFADSQEYADVLNGRRRGYSYGREGNPTVATFAAAAAALEGVGVEADIAGEAFASGMAATSTVLMALTRAGAHVIAPRQVYGGTYGALTGLLDRFGVSADFLDVRDHDAIRAALRPQTSLLWAETIANPTLTVADLPSLAAIAHQAGVPLVVDSTFASPAVCRPLAHGADLVVHSATKFLGGHSDVLGGLVLGAPPLLARIAATRSTLGGSLSPDDAFLLHRGLATLPLRMARHCASAQALAEALAELVGARPVAKVGYPGLVGSPDHALASRLFAAGRFGGVLSIVVPGGRAGAAAVCDAARLAAVASSLGGAHTTLSPVATTTHRQLDEATLERAGIDAGTVRISVGLEDPADLVSDLRAAVATGAARVASGR